MNESQIIKVFFLLSLVFWFYIFCKLLFFILSIDPFGISQAFLPEFLQLLHICSGIFVLRRGERKASAFYTSGLIKADVDKTVGSDGGHL